MNYIQSKVAAAVALRFVAVFSRRVDILQRVVHAVGVAVEAEIN